MGIRLDWEIQAEQSQVQNVGEDPIAARARRVARLKLLIIVVLLMMVVGAVVAAVILRLNEVESQIEQVLRDTVTAEVTAMRLGDREAFMCLQHIYDGKSDWREDQQQAFDSMQQLKTNANLQLQLTGQIKAVFIDDRRARVSVEEIIDGTAYTQVWFYWRFPTIAANEGEKNILKQREREIDINCPNMDLENIWLHVPPDYTFWGDLRTYVGDGVSVRYQDMDNELAVEMGLRVKEWLKDGCSILNCGELPEITLEIIPNAGLQMAWSEGNIWLLQVPSPYVSMARSDVPHISAQIVFDQDMRVETSDLQIEAARFIAERLVTIASNNLQPTYPADAYYLRQAVTNWFVGRFIRINTNSFLLDSLNANYGQKSVGSLLQIMQVDSNVSIFAPVTGVNSLHEANLDWRDFLTWRVVMESDLIKRGNLDAFLALYDTRDEALRSAAITRYDANQSQERQVVTVAQHETGLDGSPMLRATVRIGTGDTAHEEQVLFRLVNNIWLRAS